MSSRFQFWRSLHRFLSRQLLYPIVLSSLLASAIWFGRIYIGHHVEYAFLPWNLFLAWVPYVFSVIVGFLNQRYPGRGWLLLLPSLFWLTFFPNAPYVVTDLLHLDPRPPVPIWYDIGLLAAFVWTGCLIAVVSLSIMQTAVKSYWGSVASWLFVLSTIVLSGLGIYLGRFLNLNSWDLFIQPQDVLADVLVRVLHPIRHSQIYGVTLMFASFLLVCYLTFISVQQRERK
jgi:uncharacterized membrane protein